MMSRKHLTWFMVAAFAFSLAAIPMGCRERGPAEEAGRDIDRGVQELGREIEDLGRGR